MHLCSIESWSCCFHSASVFQLGIKPENCLLVQNWSQILRLMYFNWKRSCQQIVTAAFAGQPRATSRVTLTLAHADGSPKKGQGNKMGKTNYSLSARNHHHDHQDWAGRIESAVLSISGGMVSDIGFAPLVSLLYAAQNELSHIMDWNHSISISTDE